jgi:hypothetical protein
VEPGRLGSAAAGGRGWRKVSRGLQPRVALQSEGRYWDGAGARSAWLGRLSEKLARHGYRVQADEGWGRWDLRVRAAAPFTAQLVSVVEMETVLRYRCIVRPRPVFYGLAAAMAAFSLALGVEPALLPLALPLAGFIWSLRKNQTQLESALHRLADQSARELQMVPLEEEKPA